MGGLGRQILSRRTSNSCPGMAIVVVVVVFFLLFFCLFFVCFLFLFFLFFCLSWGPEPLTGNVH